MLSSLMPVSSHANTDSSIYNYHSWF